MYKWQYNGAAPMQDILDWCVENLTGQWATDATATPWAYNYHETIYFYSSEAYTYFLLRWA